MNLALAGWMHSGTRQTSFLVRSADHELIRTQAFQCRLPGDKHTRVYTCKAFASLDGIEKPDLVVFGVKSYALDGVVQQVLDAFGSDIPVMSVLNGMYHVELLTKKFKTAIFCTIGFNAYRTSPIISIAAGGTIALSSAKNDGAIVQYLYKTLKKKISVTLTDSPMDVAHCKLVINLGNALLTLVAFHDNRRRQLPELQKLTANLLWEGVRVMKKNGVKEVRISGMPPWILLWLSKVLPSFITLPIFEKKMRSTVINSMAQDLKNGVATTELEDINGYFLQLAEKVGIDIPVNKAVYGIFKQWQKDGDQPFSPKELSEKINTFSSL
ncbi:MAG: hypothetical protein JKX84_06590 [Flavobacteriales bacterium]|nr:hypothetical protein [Flavobacteriales bacterium]